VLSVINSNMKSLNKKLLVSKFFSAKSYICTGPNAKIMPKTTLTLSEPMAKTLKVYTAQTKNSMRAQSEVVEEALKEFFERHGVKVEA
jgi:hypothetical protein